MVKSCLRFFFFSFTPTSILMAESSPVWLRFWFCPLFLNPPCRLRSWLFLAMSIPRWHNLNLRVLVLFNRANMVSPHSYGLVFYYINTPTEKLAFYVIHLDFSWSEKETKKLGLDILGIAIDWKWCPIIGIYTRNIKRNNKRQIRFFRKSTFWSSFELCNHYNNPKIYIRVIGRENGAFLKWQQLFCKKFFDVINFLIISSDKFWLSFQVQILSSIRIPIPSAIYNPGSIVITIPSFKPTLMIEGSDIQSQRDRWSGNSNGNSDLSLIKPA